MSIRVASWNMAGGLPGNGNDQQRLAWDYLETMLAPDLALLQEAKAPASPQAPLLSGMLPGRGWGSAVSARISIERLTSVRMGTAEIILDRSAPGALVAATLPALGLTAVSIYGQLEGGYAVTTVNRQLSDLTFLIDSPYGQRLVIGGDLNCSTQLAPPDRARHRSLFDRFTSLGLVDLLATTADKRPRIQDCPCTDDPCTHVQTHRHSRSSAPWQDDYLFATRWLANRLVNCRVDEMSFEFSDHAAVVAEFTLD